MFLFLFDVFVTMPEPDDPWVHCWQGSSSRQAEEASWPDGGASEESLLIQVLPEELQGQSRGAIFSCDQAALWMVQSVRLSVWPSVCLSVRPSVCLSHLFDYVPIILSSWNFQELLPVTKVTSMQKVKVRGQRSRSQRSQPNLTVSGL